MAAVIKFLLMSLCLNFICADDIERVARKGVVLKLFRDMVNQTKADTLNLPANASSIRENITDTFSCENRTYGYYADVDNDCQVFHVCLTSQTTGGRNTTYRWSFICPNETVFNQEVLTCTRPRDSIDCEDSPMFYHLNDEIGKVSNETEQNKEEPKIQRRKPIRKQNIIVDNLMKEVMKDNLIAEEFAEELTPVIEVMENIDTNNNGEIMKNNQEMKPVIHKVGEDYAMKGGRMENARLSSERNLKRRGRKLNRGSFRFKADSVKSKQYLK